MEWTEDTPDTYWVIATWFKDDWETTLRRQHVEEVGEFRRDEPLDKLETMLREAVKRVDGWTDGDLDEESGPYPEWQQYQTGRSSAGRGCQPDEPAAGTASPPSSRRHPRRPDAVRRPLARLHNPQPGADRPAKPDRPGGRDRARGHWWNRLQLAEVFPTEMKLKLGYKASAEQFGPQELLDLAVLAEEKGFDSVWVSDHYQPFRHTDGHAPFSLAWLGAATQRTRRVRLGTSVLTPTFRYHPSIVAQAFATLERLAPGRVILGIGTGESMNEVPVTGMEWPEFKVRFGRLKEAVELMRNLWREDFVTYQGEYFQTKDVTLYDKPTTGAVPIYVGASGEVAARFAGRVADGFICTSGKGMELYSGEAPAGRPEGAEKAGRDYEAIVKAIEMKVSYDHDRARAMEDTKLWAPLALPAEDKAGVEDPRGAGAARQGDRGPGPPPLAGLRQR